MYVRYSTLTTTLKEIIEPVYNVCPIFDVDYHASENRQTDVSSLSEI